MTAKVSNYDVLLMCTWVLIVGCLSPPGDGIKNYSTDTGEEGKNGKIK